MSNIQITNLTLKVKDKIILNNINHTFSDSKISAIVGENRVEKTSLLKTISCEQGFDTGLIYFNNTLYSNGTIYGLNNLTTNNITIQNLLIYIEDRIIIPNSLTIETILKLFNANNPNYNTDYVTDTLKLLKISLKKSLKKYSLGEQKLIQFLTLSANFPKVLILDEPLSNLAAQKKEILIEKLQYLKQNNVNIIFTTHQLHDVYQIIDELLLLHQSKLYSELDTEILYTKYDYNINNYLKSIYETTSNFNN